MAPEIVNEAIRYEPDERCPPLTAIGVGVQGVALGLPSMVLIVAITVQSIGQDDDYLVWAVFSALVIAGIGTMLQAGRLGRIGSGHLLLMAATASFIPISVLALDAGGPATLASLIAVSGLAFLVVSIWLPLMRQVITPVVSGTVLLLVATTVIPIALDRVQDVPDATSEVGGVIAAAVTLAASAVLALTASGVFRLWSPLLGIAIGCVVAVPFGLFQFDALFAAPWVGIPVGGFPGLDLTLGAEFWALLPAFIVVTVVIGIKGIGAGVAIQQVSRRTLRATDFRLVQGALAINALGILFCGFAGTPPTTIAAGRSISLVTFTGVAARSAGFYAGVMFVCLAFFPKVTSALTAVPSPVMGGFLLTLLGALYVEGIRAVARDGFDQKRMLIVGTSIATGLGLDSQTIFADLVGGIWGSLLDNGLLMGSLTAILLTVVMALTRPRPKRLRVNLDDSALPKTDDFLIEIASAMGWIDSALDRLRAVGEESMTCFVRLLDEQQTDGVPRVMIEARPSSTAIDLEFLAVFDEENFEDRLAYLDEEVRSIDEGDISLRLLRHYASSVRHQKYHGLDVVAVRVEKDAHRR